MSFHADLQRPVGWRRTGIWVLALVSAIGLVLAAVGYLNPANGIHGSAGALLVVISTLLMLGAALVIALWVRRGWVRGTLLALILLDIFGTAAAGYLLESYWLVGAMVLALLLWLVGVFAPRAPARLAEGTTP